MNRYLVRVAVGFAVGGLIAALGMIFSVLPFAIVTGSSLRFSARSHVLIGVIGAFSISGAIGGASLGKGWRSVIGFGLAFGVLGAWMSGMARARVDGSVVASIVFNIMVLLFPPAFGLAGAIGAAISGLGWKMVLVGAGAFGGAGAAAIGVTVVAILGQAPESQRIGSQGSWVVFVPLLITYALGGAVFVVASEYPSYKRKKLGLCVKCGYDLQGLPKHGHQCPECGTPFELTVNKPPAR